MDSLTIQSQMFELNSVKIIALLNPASMHSEVMSLYLTSFKCHGPISFFSSVQTTNSFTRLRHQKALIDVLISKAPEKVTIDVVNSPLQIKN